MNQHVTHERRYRVVVCGRLGDGLAGTFDQLEVETRLGETSLTGSFADQAQLHALLDRLRDLGITLISVNPVDFGSIRSQTTEATTNGSTVEIRDPMGETAAYLRSSARRRKGR